MNLDGSRFVKVVLTFWLVLPNLAFGCYMECGEASALAAVDCDEDGRQTGLIMCWETVSLLEITVDRPATVQKLLPSWDVPKNKNGCSAASHSMCHSLAHGEVWPAEVSVWRGLREKVQLGRRGSSASVLSLLEERDSPSGMVRATKAALRDHDDHCAN